ncbi:MAG: DUF547 domain-containing protein [Sandaracinaceae bacterium]|nr:DUF547 domain-containing protein [Sandaracinaceae bacterium]
MRWLGPVAALLIGCSGADAPAERTAPASPEPARSEEPTAEPAAEPAAETGPDVVAWQTLLTEYATADGGFRYEALRANAAHRALLDGFVERVGSARPTAWSRDAQLAFYIDAYNALVVHLVLERWPLESVIRSEGFFDGARHLVAGTERTLNELEGDVIRSETFAEPRIHFAVSCASAGCPPLSRTAYTAENLEAQLTARTREFVHSSTDVDLERRRVRTSQIFEWYADDFGGPAGVRAFLADHLDGAEAAVVRDQATPIEHVEYDWALNARP